MLLNKVRRHDIVSSSFQTHYNKESLLHNMLVNVVCCLFYSHNVCIKCILLVLHEVSMLSSLEALTVSATIYSVNSPNKSVHIQFEE